MNRSAAELRDPGSPRETERRRSELALLRDHLEQLLCTLLRAMPRTEVENLLADCGSRELMQFGREAVAASVVTALLQEPERWARVREAVRRGTQRAHARHGDPVAQREAAELARQLLARLDFGLDAVRRGRRTLDCGLAQVDGTRGTR